MRVVVDGVIFRIGPNGGVARVFREILPRMAATQGVQIDLLLPRGSANWPVAEGIRVREVIVAQDVLRPRRLWGPLHATADAAAHGLRTLEDRGAVWHSTYFTRPLGERLPEVVTVHDMTHERFAHVWGGRGADRFRETKRRAVLKARRVICVSHTTAQDVIEMLGVHETRVVVTHLAASPSFRQTHVEPSRLPPGVGSSPFILFVGSRHGLKGFDTLLEAYVRWPDRQHCRLVVVGPPFGIDERRMLKEYAVEDRVTGIGSLDDGSLCALYNAAECFVYPSHWEGFGIPLLEAMICGCPLVASRIPTTVEVAGECPAYFESRQPEAVIAALDAALAAGRDSARVRDGLERARQFSWDECARKTAGVYCEALEPPTSVAGESR